MPNRDKLAEFTTWCAKHITGDEKGQAQIFLDRLFQAFGQPGCLDVGGATEFRIRKSNEDGGGTAFADYVWKPVVLIEMKKRGENLQKHYRQAFDYWTRLVPNRPRYVVLCNFDEFRVYDFDTDLDTPKDTVATKDLPERWGPLAFLAPGNPKPNFENDRVAVTTQAADKLAECFRTLIKRGESRELAQKFILQMLVALFAEDIDLLPKYFVSNLLNECKTPADGFDIIGGLFEAMNSKAPKTGGRFKGVPHFNGGLFVQPARIEINDIELNLLKKAASFDWSKVQPEIFGTLFQHSQGFQKLNQTDRMLRRPDGRHFFKEETFAGNGCHTLKWQQRHRAKTGVHSSQQRNQRLAPASAFAWQARFCFQAAAACRIRGRLLLARLPQAWSKASQQPRLLAFKAHPQQTQGSSCFEKFAQCRMACGPLLVSRPKESHRSYQANDLRIEHGLKTVRLSTN